MTATSAVKLRVVPEPEVKRMLQRRGVRVPRGTTDLDAIESLSGPLVLKAFGAEIIHKSDVGAVRLGLSWGEVDAAVADMRTRLDVAGFLVEEHEPPGVELIVGVLDRGYGLMVAVGMGGTLAEVLDDIVLGCVPVTSPEVKAMLLELRGAPILLGTRGRPGVDLDAVADVVVAMCDLAIEIGPELAELECNPIFARADGAVAVDARLLLRDAVVASGDIRPVTDFRAMFQPRGIAVVGASTQKRSHGTGFLDAYKAMGWRDGLYAVHPTAEFVDGVPAFPTVSAIPGPVDYVVAAVPAVACAGVVRDAAGTAGFVHVTSGGFAEAGDEGLRLERELGAVAREVGVRVLGPNCMGISCANGRQAFQLNVSQNAGHIGFVSQSGGLAGDIVKVGDRHGLRFSKVVSLGNAVDITPAEICDYLIADADTHVIGLYLEDPRDGSALVHSLARARGRKPVVCLIGGLSRQGGRTVASHTGSLAGDRRVWQAIARHAGLVLVETFGELVATLAYLQRYGADRIDADPSVLIVGVGGGASVLIADSCDRNDLAVVPTTHRARGVLADLGYGTGTLNGNPVEIPISPMARLDVFANVVPRILAAQRYSDVLLHMNCQVYTSHTADGLDKLLGGVEALSLVSVPGTRVAFVARNLEVVPPALGAEFRARAHALDHVFFESIDEAVVAIGAAQQFGSSRGK